MEFELDEWIADCFVSDRDGHIAVFCPHPEVFGPYARALLEALFKNRDSMLAFKEYLEAEIVPDLESSPVPSAVYYRLLDDSKGQERKASLELQGLHNRGDFQRALWSATHDTWACRGVFQFVQFSDPCFSGDCYAIRRPESPLETKALPPKHKELLDRWRIADVNFADTEYLPLSAFPPLAD
ncbi:MAG: hypothetical protein KDB32_09010 [Planctomycetes bacterium]|nr:hypothetical protein [Planctomycetota bacterium]MCA8945483.1 hypothetical protein [Planctomycetota bacterium]